jgi:hypothetical protein
MGTLITSRPDVSRALAQIIQRVDDAKRDELEAAYLRAATINGLPKWAREALAAQGIT